MNRWGLWVGGRGLLLVPFPIDELSQPFRRPSELRRLAEAASNAGDYDETRWNEWKSRLDLASRPARLHLLRQILGFANRDPEVAERWCQGNAHLLIGVSPGRVDGVTAMDHPRLVRSLQPYVGTEIVWSPEYVELDGREVLVVETGPPALGDPIHFLLKDFFVSKIVQTPDGPVEKPFGFHEGTIFVRRHGEVERATASPATTRASAVRLQARKVRSLAKVNRASGSRSCGFSIPVHRPCDDRTKKSFARVRDRSP